MALERGSSLCVNIYLVQAHIHMIRMRDWSAQFDHHSNKYTM